MSETSTIILTVLAFMVIVLIIRTLFNDDDYIDDEDYIFDDFYSLRGIRDEDSW